MTTARNRFGGFTRHRDGWVRWYRGKTRFVAGKSATPDEIERRWSAIKAAIDHSPMPRAEPGPAMPLREMVSRFLDACESRNAAGTLSKRSVSNYAKSLNRFAATVGPDRDIGGIGPTDFTAYLASLSAWKSNSVTTHITEIRIAFSWAVRMEFMPSTRFGAEFRGRPMKDIRDDRIRLAKRFSPDEIAKLLAVADRQWQCIIWLACVGGLNGAEISAMDADDFDGETIDFRRRKKGRIRRIIPLPPSVAKLLNDVIGDRSGAVFLDASGIPMDPASSHCTRVFRRLMDRAGVTIIRNRGFSGLRTTFFNLAPRGYRDEVEIVGGHALGSVLKDYYLETVDIRRLRYVTRYVYSRIALAVSRRSAR